MNSQANIEQDFSVMLYLVKNWLSDIWNYSRFSSENMSVHSGPTLHK